MEILILIHDFPTELPKTIVLFREDITKYGLYLTEDDGEVDWDFPCLDPREIISKFEFPA